GWASKSPATQLNEGPCAGARPFVIAGRERRARTTLPPMEPRRRSAGAPHRRPAANARPIAPGHPPPPPPPKPPPRPPPAPPPPPPLTPPPPPPPAPAVNAPQCTSPRPAVNASPRRSAFERVSPFASPPERRPPIACTLD